MHLRLAMAMRVESPSFAVLPRLCFSSSVAVLALQGMKVKMKDMASKLGLGGAGNPFGALGQ